MQRRFEQTAGARGMTLQDVARAESAARPKMPEPAATINFGLLKKEDTSSPEARLDALRGRFAAADAKDPNSPETKALRTELDALQASVEKVLPKEAPDSEKLLKRLKGAAMDAEQKFGRNSKEYTDAANKYSAALSVDQQLTPDQQSHAKMMDKAQFILFNPTSNATPEQKAEAKKYVDNYEEYKRRQKATGEPDEKIPTPNSLISIGRTAGANAVRATYGVGALGKQLSFITNADGSTSMQYSGDKPDVQKQLIRREQEGVAAAMRPYMTPDGKVADKKVEVALQSFGITLDANRRPVDADGRRVLIETPRTPTAAPAAPAASAQSTRPATPTEVADDFANIGAPVGAAPRAAPAKPAAASAQDKFVVGKEYIDAAGNRAVYRGNGKWEPVTR
jgi:hypothetical protein